MSKYSQVCRDLPGAIPIRVRRLLLLAASSLALTACSAIAADKSEPSIVGKISYYGQKFAGRPTASGERFNPQAMTMAHRKLPFGSKVRLTNLANGRQVVLRVNDRGPFAGKRIADVSLAAAKALAMVKEGVIRARLTVLSTPSGSNKGKP